MDRPGDCRDHEAQDSRCSRFVKYRFTGCNNWPRVAP
jgi:hypothetical protein